MLCRRFPKLVEDRVPKANTEGTKSSASQSILFGWKTYLSQKVVLASLGYVLLYCTALSPGGLLAGYLVYDGLSELEIGVFRAVMALVGIVATFCADILIKRYGPVRAGGALLYSQFACVCIAAAVFVLGGLLRTFLVIVTLSRFGLYGFDMAQVQIMQTGVERCHVGTVNSIETSLTNVLGLLPFLATLVLGLTPGDFLYLVLLSAAFVSAATMLYTLWTLRYACTIPIPAENLTGAEATKGADV